MNTFRNSRRCATRRHLLGMLAATAAGITLSSAALVRRALAAESRPRFQRIPVQYIAALAADDDTAGDNAQLWGLWRKDPGPRGVPLDNFERLLADDGIAPARWQFSQKNWWLEEHGLIMEAPEFPLPPGHYLVTGSRETSAMLTVHPALPDGSMRWELDNAATVYDVTHLRCRSARYTPADSNASCSPARAEQSAFPVSPGAPMPPVPGCAKQDFAVLIVYAVAEGNA